MSWIFAAFMIGYFLGQLPTGWLGDRVGSRTALAVLIAAWSAFTAWSAVSQALAPLIISQFAAGLTQAGLVPISSIAIKDWFPASRRGFPSAVISAAMSAGGVIAMWLTGRLIKTWDNNWQRVFLIYAVAGIAWALLFFLFFRSRPEVPPESEFGGGAALDDQDAGSAKQEAMDSPLETLLKMAGSLSVWALGVQWFFKSAGYQFFARWFPAFLQERYAMPVDQSGFYSSWPLVGVAVGSIAGGVIVDVSFQRTGSKWISRNGTSIVSLLLCAGCLAAAEACRSGQTFVAWMAVGAIFSGMSMPTGWAANIDIAGRSTGLLFAVMNMSATAAGIVAPTCVGYLMTHIPKSGAPYGTIVFLHVGIYVAAAAAWFVVNPNRSLDEERAEAR
jgi:ACS family glucarate transporter-like MFS transporter/ACS family D-galactonate transporter-like MFS transporter